MRFLIAVLLVLAAPVSGATAAEPTERHPILVDAGRISAERLERWVDTARRMDAPREAAISLLVTNRWIELELDRSGVPDVSRARAVREARAMRRQAFRSRRAYRRFLRRTGQTHRQIVYRTRSDLRHNRLRRHATAGAKSFDEEFELWQAHGESMRSHWRPLTRCTDEWFLPDVCGAAG